MYFGGVTTTQAIFRTLTDQEQQPHFAVVVSTLAIAALFSPLRRQVQSFVDRRFYHRKYNVTKTLETFYIKLRYETNLETLNDDLVGVVADDAACPRLAVVALSDRCEGQGGLTPPVILLVHPYLPPRLHRGRLDSGMGVL